MRNININSQTLCSNLKIHMDKLHERCNELNTELHKSRVNMDCAEKEARYYSAQAEKTAEELRLFESHPLVAMPYILENEEKI
uniref:DUF2524 family protein n=1 Tax=Parastrongyloides trichosuri TaxID=131310 RepID=A0A0N4ZZJ7_PARTI